MGTEESASRWKLGVALWIAGMIGVCIMAVAELPVVLAQYPSHHAIKLPMSVLMTLVVVQTGLYLAGFVWCGIAFASKVGLRAPAFEALVQHGRVGATLVPQILPGLLGGLLMGVIPWYFTSHGLIIEIHTPAALLTAVSYGGLTEEIMMRWGIMSLLVWLGWRFTGRNPAGPSSVVLWAGILVSAVLFGAGHLPAAHLLNPQLTSSMAGSIIGAGAVFGIVAGYLYHRWGLESAIICHATSHLCAYAIYKIL